MAQRDSVNEMGMCYMNYSHAIHEYKELDFSPPISDNHVKKALSISYVKLLCI